MTTIWLIRHGESTANAGAVTHDPSSIPLTATGWQQARHLADQFEACPDLIVTSPFLRTLQTAAPTRSRFYQTRHEIWPIQEFTYLDPASCVGTTVEQRRARVQAYWQAKDVNYIDGSGAESFSLMLLRVRLMLATLATQQGFIVVFGHGQIMRAAQLIQAYPSATDAELMQQFHNAPPIPNAYIMPLPLNGLTE
ncbi:MAG TPA: histidine phosphatase family protein [Thiolinea sp.]|nr:histidine phosphatase family protein [Thiolinea sp.]